MTRSLRELDHRVPDPVLDDWVCETRFGKWFQGTRMWGDYVVTPALAELRRLCAVGASGLGRVLDGGCGDGVAFRALDEDFAASSVTAVDIDPEMVELAGRRAALSPLRIPLEVRRANVEKLDLEDASFDAVLCHQTLHHVVDQQAALGEFRRVLRPGGILLLSESCRRFIRSPLIWLLFRHPNGVQRTAEGYCELLEDAGFAAEDHAIVTPDPFWSRRDYGLKEALGRPVRQRGDATQLIAVARTAPRSLGAMDTGGRAPPSIA